MNKNKTKIYYTILLLVLGIKVVSTVFSNGLSVHHGKKIAQLQVQKNNLLEQQMRLNSELSGKASLLEITQEFDTSEYIAISNPIILTSSIAVASK